MASIFTLRGRPNLMVSWFDGTGRRRLRSSGTTDRRAAQRLAEKLETSSMMQREGLADPRDENFKKGARTPLAEHVKAFCEHLRAKGASEKHVANRSGQLTRVVEAMRVDRVAMVTAGRLHAALAALKTSRGISARTQNHVLVAMKALSRWLVAEGLIASDPLAGVRQINGDADPRHKRRALGAEEAAKLIAAAESGRDACGLSGRDRAALYRIALGSGLRASEIESLTSASFDLDGEPPTITVRPCYAKNRKEARQPIRRDLADILRPWVANKPKAEPVFKVTGRLSLKTAAMVRVDLEMAGIAYTDGEGRFADFHSLRHSYVSALVRSGANVKSVQALARHSTPMLTLQCYSHVEQDDLAKALEKMPATAGNVEPRSVEKAG